MKRLRSKSPTVFLLLISASLILSTAVALSTPSTGSSYPKEAVEAYIKAIELNPNLVSSIEDPKLSKLLGRTFLEDGKELLAAGDLIAAENKLLIAGNFHECFELFRALAQCYFRQERFEASLVLFKKALARQSQNAELKAEMAQAYLRFGKKEAALRLFCKALSQNTELKSYVPTRSIREELVERLVERSRKLSNEERHVEAAKLLKVAVSLDAKPSLYLEVGKAYVKAQNRKAAARAFALAVREAPKLCKEIRRPSMKVSTGRVLFSQGVEAYKGGVYERAEELFRLSFELDERGTTIYNLADCAVRLKKIDDAVNLYNQAIKLDPSIKNTYLNLAIIYIDKGMAPKAVKRLRKLITQSPATAQAYELLARAFLAQGKEKEAVEAYRTAIEYDIGLEEHLSNKSLRAKTANSLYESAKTNYDQKRYQEALVDLAGAEALRQEGRFKFLAGNVHYALNNLNKALSCYEGASSIAPGSPKILNNMGNLYLKLGKTEEALHTFERAVKVAPNYAQAYNNLGICLKKKGRIEESIVAYKRALEIKPDYAAAHFNLGNAYASKRSSNQYGQSN